MNFVSKSYALILTLLLSGMAMAQNNNPEIVLSEITYKVSKHNKRLSYFSDNASVTMADGSIKPIADVKIGENVKTCKNGKSLATQVKQIDVYEHPNSALTAVYLRPTGESYEQQKLVPAIIFEATPNHLVQIKRGKKRMKKLSKNDILYHYEPETGIVSTWKVGAIHTNARKVNKAYNITTEDGTYLVGNVVMAQ